MSSYNSNNEKGLIHTGLVFEKALQEVLVIVTHENEGATETPVAVDFPVVCTCFRFYNGGRL